jgi:protein ImuA
MIEALRQSLRRLEKPAGIGDEAGALPLGVAAIDSALGGGLARGAVHEIAAAGEAHVAAAAAFAVALSSLGQDGRAANSVSPLPWGEVGAQPKSDVSDFGQSKVPNSGKPEFGGERESHCIGGTAEVPRHLVWIAEDMVLAESGAPYGPGLDAFGLAPERLLTVAAAHTRDLLWAIEEALRCRAVSAVIGEIRHGAIDMVTARRLSLATAQSGAPALLLRASPPRDASTAATRWIVSAAPHECFAVQLTRNRRGPLGAWTLQWSNEDERFVCATPALPVAAPAADRPRRQVA